MWKIYILKRYLDDDIPRFGWPEIRHFLLVPPEYITLDG